MFDSSRTSSASKWQVTHDRQLTILTWLHRDNKSIPWLPLTTITIRKVKFHHGHPSKTWSPKCTPSHCSGILALVTNLVSEFLLLMGLSPQYCMILLFHLPAACQHFQSPGFMEVLRCQHPMLHPNVNPTAHMGVKVTWRVLSLPLRDSHCSFAPLLRQDSPQTLLNVALAFNLPLVIQSLVILLKISRHLVTMILLLPDLSGFIELIPLLSSCQQCHWDTT